MHPGTQAAVETLARVATTSASRRGTGFLLFCPSSKVDGRNQTIYIYKLVKESKLRASRISGKKSLIRRADIELMMKTKPYERIMPEEDFDITEYYTAEEIAEKYKVNAKWVWTYTRQRKVPKVRIRQFNYYSKKTYRCCLCQIRGGFRPDRMVHTGRYSGEVRHDMRRHPFAGVSEQYPIQERTRTNLLFQAPFRPI